MTREEELQQFAEQNTKGLYLDRHNLIQMVKQGAVWADQHPHWIPVEERLPEERGHYLVYSQFGDVWLSEWMQDKKGRWDWYVAPICVGIISKVTHWMPLPPAPRKEE